MTAPICITGIWHQGTVLAGGLAALGHDVRAFADPETAALLTRGAPPVHEPGLPELLERNLREGRLRVFEDLAEALAGAEFAFISTDTPVGLDDEPALEGVFALASAIGAAASGDLVLCVTAQVPVGTTERLRTAVQQELNGNRVEAAYVPEFLRLGTAVESFENADRFVVGTDSEEVAQRVAAIFSPLGRPLVVTSVRTAEMAKHAANTFLATSISFANEISDLCEQVGADPVEVARILKLDKRIGPHAYLSPGLGYAGGTLGRELRVLQALGAEHGVETKLVDAVVAVNDSRPQLVRRRLGAALGDLSGRRVALFGLTYKPGTSTLRRAISLEIARDLQGAGAEVAAYDPLADIGEVEEVPALVAESPYDAAAGAAAIVLVTEWQGIEGLDLERLRASMSGNVFLDTRNVLSSDALRRAGFRQVRI